MSDLQRAIEIAVSAHKGQLDKGGSPYILHPLRVMLMMEGADRAIYGSDSDIYRIVAVLHDVCEHCSDWYLIRLRMEGFSEKIIDALDHLTRREGEEYESFILRACHNAISIIVKTADLIDNCDMSRIKHPKDEDLIRLEKYKKSLDMIDKIIMGIS